jgi:iron complex outermembrane receptor protein
LTLLLCCGAALGQVPPGSAASAVGPASDPSLEELLRTELPRGSAEVAVSTASRLAQSADLAPAVTHVVTRQEIQRLGLRHFTDVLRRLPGFHARDDREFARVSVRGVGPGDFNGRVLFLLDGQRLNENIYDAGQIDLDFPVDVSLIERVEFTPGPGSALYGANALLGVVNVVTQRADRLAGPQLHLSLAPRGRQDARLSYAQRHEDGSEWLASYSFVRWPIVPQLFDVLQPFELETRPYEWDDVRRGQIAYRKGGFSARALYVDRVRGIPAYVETLEGYLQGTDQTFARSLQAGWEGRLGDWDATLALSMQQQRYRLDTPSLDQDSGVPVEGFDRFEALGRWGIVEARAGRAWLADHYLLAGLEWQRDLRQRFRYEYVGYERYQESYDARRLGLFLQDEWALSERQRLVLGLRHDRAEGAASRWSPRLAWSWSPEPGSSLKLMWGRAFRSPNRFETAVNTAYQLAAPRAESVESLELAAETALDEVWRLRTAFYLTRLRGPIDALDEGGYGNGAGQRLRGLDLGIEAGWRSGWQLQLAITALRLRDAATGRPNFTPTWQAKWSLTAPLGLEGLRLSLHGWAQSRRRGDGAEVGDLPGYAVNNAQLLWALSPRLDLFVGVQNLGGRRWVEPIAPSLSSVTLAREGEQWHGGLQWRP